MNEQGSGEWFPHLWENKSLFFSIFKKNYLSIVELSYNVVLISAVHQSDSVIHIYILFHILFHYGLSQDIGYSSLCYTVGSCCLGQTFINSEFWGSWSLHRHRILLKHIRYSLSQNINLLKVAYFVLYMSQSLCFKDNTIVIYVLL